MIKAAILKHQEGKWKTEKIKTIFAAIIATGRKDHLAVSLFMDQWFGKPRAFLLFLLPLPLVPVNQTAHQARCGRRAAMASVPAATNGLEYMQEPHFWSRS